MSDLISRSALIKILKEWADTNAMRGYDTAYDVVQDCISTVENQPTAYDVDAVVKELEDSVVCGMFGAMFGKSDTEIIDIIKAGGVK